MTILIIAMKIHISVDCKNALDDLHGGYRYERRGFVEIQVRTFTFQILK